MYLGAAYYKGHGVAQAYEKAVELWEKAAAQGQADALCSVGNAYYNGRDYEKAMECWEKAAAQEQPDALCSLGEAYKMGRA